MLKKVGIAMKIRTLKYHIEQGIRGLLKNGLMSIASIAIVSACIFILILSLCCAVNIDYLLAQVESNVGVTLYIGPDPTEAQIAELEAELKTMEHVTNVKYFSKDAALEDAKEMWADTGMLDGLKEDNPFPRSLEIKIDEIKNQATFIASLEKVQLDFENKIVNSVDTAQDGAEQTTTEQTTIAQSTTLASEVPVVIDEGGEVESAEVVSQDIKIGEPNYEFKGIEKISHAQKVTDVLMTINAVVRVISIVLIIIMSIIAVGIVMNTIKLTVFIRKNEIGIMKYVGATDWFIRWPFIIEGILIGLIGAVIPCVICWGSYDRLLILFETKLSMLNNIATLKGGAEIFSVIVPVSLVLGALLGAIGSINSIRKHLNV